ncbi:MAG: AAA family ATPase [Pseudomonadota bacterium]
MELVLFLGIQATGKSTFYKQRYADTHIRLNLDMLRTRHRETILLNACLAAKQPCVIDNTNPTKLERARYIEAAQQNNFSVKGLFFASGIEAALSRNQSRPKDKIIPELAIRGTRNRLETPDYGEGFDRLHYVTTTESGDFSVVEWESDI